MNSIELFAGCGGFALGLELAGFNPKALVECDKDACNTLRVNNPNWNVIQSPIEAIDFTQYQNIDLVSGGFPCQAFSYAGKRLGFDDTRGTLFYEFARAISEIKPKMFVAENVKGLLTHDNGRTLSTILNVLSNIGYTVLQPEVLNAKYYNVPQQRERLFIIGYRNDLSINFKFPSPLTTIPTLKDALYNVPHSVGSSYSKAKYDVLKLVPEGGNWKNLPEEIQRSYMKKSYYNTGGRTGIARRMSWNEPCLTLLCSPSSLQTERCHPSETRPFTIREYARIQTFPDSYHFVGSIASQYRQIGNAVPVNLAYHIGIELMKALVGE